jgi:CelD/BcsL family acetyltransferase involved in cellulose biosynthesis
LKLELLDPYSPRVETTWRALEEVAKPLYFLTWGWMENWLACLPRTELPRLAIVERDGRPVAACFVGSRLLRRHGVVPSRSRFVNAVGIDPYDEVCLEHNALLSIDSTATFATLVALLPGSWDEVHLPACAEHAFAELRAVELGADLQLRIDREVANYHVELDKVREHGYIRLLGSSTRAQMRKAQRAAGEVTTDVAHNEREAMTIYNELVALHQRSWRQRGQPGAWADPWFDRFHRRLIAQRFALGEIQLIRVRNAEQTIGCLYNFVSSGRVLFYQSGFATIADRNLRPGYLCHAHAIEHSAQQGHAIYDLLGGDSRYKQSLSTGETRLVWGRVQRRRLQFVLEDVARAWFKR